ncbi:hypothetical protein DUI87_18444 [Hirundo rustica rustica]|uniref:Uncharacterized protein n=1 Tax=Hirundo rustica rustica TaxID=333673 RepID=A0A3M0JWK8_HIRRU|nr:hypothetical protein DUI87_18444 [Hirundo rustica rustica]
MLMPPWVVGVGSDGLVAAQISSSVSPLEDEKSELDFRQRAAEGELHEETPVSPAVARKSLTAVLLQDNGR